MLLKEHINGMLLSSYLAEEVGQDLLCEGGCHRAELQRREIKRIVRQVNIISEDLINPTQRHRPSARSHNFISTAKLQLMKNSHLS